MRLLLPILFLAALPGRAHHPFTPYYDVSKEVTVSGVIAEFRIINPHVVLIVDVSEPDGRTSRWGFEGYPPHQFQRQGSDLMKLKPGQRIKISGWAAKDPNAHVFSGREITFQDGSTMLFGPTPPEADLWICGGPNPCPYKYPDVPAQPVRN